jgi:hypothetical protein
MPKPVVERASRPSEQPRLVYIGCEIAEHGDRFGKAAWRSSWEGRHVPLLQHRMWQLTDGSEEPVSIVAVHQKPMQDQPRTLDRGERNGRRMLQRVDCERDAVERSPRRLVRMIESEQLVPAGKAGRVFVLGDETALGAGRGLGGRHDRAQLIKPSMRSRFDSGRILAEHQSVEATRQADCFRRSTSGEKGAANVRFRTGPGIVTDRESLVREPEDRLE